MLDRIRAYLDRCLTLSETDMAYFVSCLSRRRLNRRERLIGPDERAEFELFVESGCLRVYCASEDGMDRNLYFALEDSWICHGLMSARQGDIAIGIEAVESSNVLCIDRAAKERLCDAMPTFERWFRVLAEQSLDLLQQRLILSMQHTAEGRYLEFRRRYPDLEQRLPQYHIASYLGICPEFLSRIKRNHYLEAIAHH